MTSVTKCQVNISSIDKLVLHALFRALLPNSREPETVKLLRVRIIVRFIVVDSPTISRKECSGRQERAIGHSVVSHDSAVESY